MKWAAPLESGGLPLEYVVEMNPPPGKGDANVVPPSTSDVRLCCFKICRFGRTKLARSCIHQLTYLHLFPVHFFAFII